MKIRGNVSATENVSIIASRNNHILIKVLLSVVLKLNLEKSKVIICINDQALRVLSLRNPSNRRKRKRIRLTNCPAVFVVLFMRQLAIVLQLAHPWSPFN